MEILGLIPARSGSTEVKHKNIRDLKGKPLIAHTIEAAKASGLSRVVLSTDSDEYAEVARKFGAETPYIRPPELATSVSSAIEVVRHALEFFSKAESWRPDAVMYLQPTSPFRTSDAINRAIALLNDEVDSVISLVKAKEHPYYMFSMEEEQQERPRSFVNLSELPERRQDMPTIYSYNCSILLSKTDYLEHKNTTLIANLKNFNPLVISEREAIDINSEVDFLVASALANEQQDKD